MSEADLLRTVRARTLAVFGDLAGDDLLGVRAHHLEPPLWELGHVAWFQEYWLLRHLAGDDPIEDRDGAYDSFKVSYRERWDHDFPDRDGMLAYAEAILDRTVATLGDAPTEEQRYFCWLAAQHEAMHTENITLVRQNLATAVPELYADPMASPDPEPIVEGDAEIPGGTFELGAARDGPGPVFDNEKWAHPVEVAPFAIARTAVTEGQFAEFVDGGGYENRELWDKKGWEWQRRRGTPAPLYWEHRDGGWWVRRFDGGRPLDPARPICHVNWHEAQAYCRFAGRRLPTEAEWEFAAAVEPSGHKRRFPWGDAAPDHGRCNLDGWFGGTVDVRALAAGDSPWGCRQMLGNVWEWVENDLTAYPGFEVDPYKEYSVPYLGQKPVLRGGAWTTWPGLIRTTWRNFYLRQRRNIFAGLRTCAVS